MSSTTSIVSLCDSIGSGESAHTPSVLIDASVEISCTDPFSNGKAQTMLCQVLMQNVFLLKYIRYDINLADYIDESSLAVY